LTLFLFQAIHAIQGLKAFIGDDGSSWDVLILPFLGLFCFRHIFHLIELLEDGRDEEPMREERDRNVAKEEERGVHTSDVSEEVHDWIYSPGVNGVLRVESEVEYPKLPLSVVVLRFVEMAILKLHKGYLIELPKLYVVIL